MQEQVDKLFDGIATIVIKISIMFLQYPPTTAQPPIPYFCKKIILCRQFL